MKLIKTICAENSIKWKIGKLSLSRVLIDERLRLVVYFLGVRIFREPLDTVLRTQHAKQLLTQFKSNISQQSITREQSTNFEINPEPFKTLLRLQAWNIVAKQLHNSYK